MVENSLLNKSDPGHGMIVVGYRQDSSKVDLKPKFILIFNFRKYFPLELWQRLIRLFAGLQTIRRFSIPFILLESVE